MIDLRFAAQADGLGAIVYPLFKNGFDTVKGLLPQGMDALATSKAKVQGFEAKAGQVLALDAPDGTSVVLVGLGEAEKVKMAKVEEHGGKAYNALKALRVKDAFLSGEALGSDVDALLAHFAFGVQVKSYRFDELRTTLKEKDLPALKEVVVEEGAKVIFEDLDPIASSIAYVRDLVNLPPNILNPHTYADRIEELSSLGLKIEVLDEKELEKLGMRTMLGVGQGSVTLPRLAIMRWEGGKEGDAPVALVGKGVTFDSGGYSLKPSTGMETMKADMAGSAIVVGTMRMLAMRKAKVNAVGVVALVENMVSSKAQRVSDVVKSYKGITVEILNTDAEGRLILADALTYTDQRFKPKKMLDFATLTGAIIISLGHEHAGLFTRSDDLANELLEDGLASGDKLWRLPLTEEYESHIKSDVADIKNIGERMSAGSVSAAEFLRRFVDEKTPWAHLDVAGVEMLAKDTPLGPKGATGYGLRLMNTWFKRYEG